MGTENRVLGIDFGTSNSAAGFMRDGEPFLIEVEDAAQTLPTAFFFESDTKNILVGSPANTALIDGEDGRFMRALKRVLGTPLMHEPRTILGKRVTFVEIIGAFLEHIKDKAQHASGQTFDVALSGRPVHFHVSNLERDAQAEDDLRRCYLAAGFEDVRFLAEPEAAAIASGGEAKSGLGLIVDIGGGTSDFSLFETSVDGSVNVMANHGVRIGGTDFDRVLSIDLVMPLLGQGTQLRNHLGAGTLMAPQAIFNDLATWEKIPFLYGSQTRRKVGQMAAQAVEAEKFERLVAVLEDELGHSLAFAVEEGKIAANGSEHTVGLDLRFLDRGLDVEVLKQVLHASMAPFSEAIRLAALDTLQIAGCSPDQLDRVIYVGGSSLMGFVGSAMQETFPDADHEFSEVFTAVAKGLAIASGK